MWMPQQIPDLAPKLVEMGFTGDPKAFADLTGFPMGAIISLGGCSASFVSPEGLIATNHHCVQGALQVNSTPDKNLIEDGFLARTKDVGAISGEQAVAWGLTGPSMRASGVDWDNRRDMPYAGYETYEFDVPVEQEGDVYARYRCRMREMRECLRLIRQGLDRLKPGPVNIDNHKIVPPPRAELGRSMEAVIHHFKLWTEGF
ncbi:hypothetical protein FBQ97_17175, partial [Acidobacteria bacterium ACD]|nr:hypothetical protein [Acidobacteria bacterium ACD]